MNDTTQDTMDRMNRINRKIFTFTGKSHDDLIGKGQIHILKEIIDNKNITQDSLARLLDLDKTTIAKAVKRLEEKGLIVRSKSKYDRRKNELAATARASLMKESMEMHRKAYTRAVFAGIDEEALKQFDTTLKKIEANIETKRKEVADKKHFGLQVMKLLVSSPGMKRVTIAEHFHQESSSIEEIVEKLKMKQWVEEKEGGLFVTTVAKEWMKDNTMELHEQKRSEDKQAQREAFLVIVKNNGLTKAELLEKTGMDEHCLDAFLSHLEKKGLLEIQEGKLFVHTACVQERKGKA